MNSLENLYIDYLQIRDEARQEQHEPNHQIALDWKENFYEALNNDINTPKALSVLFEMMKEKNLSAKNKRVLIKEFAEDALGLPISRLDREFSSGNMDLPKNISEMAKQYDQLRTNKQFIQSDALRKEIEALGYSVRDTENGSYIVRKFF